MPAQSLHATKVYYVGVLGLERLKSFWYYSTFVFTRQLLFNYKLTRLIVYQMG